MPSRWVQLPWYRPEFHEDFFRHSEINGGRGRDAQTHADGMVTACKVYGINPVSEVLY
jgi:hypothetical protein